MWDKFVHRWLFVPYALYVRTKKKGIKPRKTVLFLHGIGNSGAAWQDVIDKLPDDIRVISIDLLGFGQSPRPKKVIYDARTQSRAVIATLLKAGITGRLVIVGHSLGALVAVEVAKRYPVIVRSLILCSPPFYLGEDNHISLRRERRLRNLYRLIQKHPEQFVKISALGAKYNVVNKAYSVTNDDVEAFMDTVESSILNQTALKDAQRLRKPMTILHGRFDSYVIKANLKYLTEHNDCASLRVVAAGHEVRGRYIAAVVDEITK